MKPYNELQKEIENMPFQSAVNKIVTEYNGTRDPMGSDLIARFYLTGPDYYTIMFYNHEGFASKPTFCFND